ncbi:hypothetical protein SAMN02745247_01536 [Butyrivibrio hungatei DSM 14810]|uniref:Winged helix-turn-helix DNA-binding n=1 Tax=Butyrivibrio hungatei DSM 14810 TaxID=1121132 RepID=A0A1M7SDU0_9FIRM|nr:hypothetical protein [Butyrivibrio hungatei]SHN56614.1 hypothetical protein SAMN02745247_01536 [Butyrivibrio hungatei DSM 14810]
MNDIQKIEKLMVEKKYDRLIEIFEKYIDDVKETLHEDKPEQLDLSYVYELAMKYGKIATLLSENANVSKTRCFFDGGYFTALVEELELLLEKLERIQEFDKVYQKIIGKKHYEKIISLLYGRDLLQSKFISEKLNIKPNYLSKIMRDMLDYKIIVAYEYSKYKYYGLTWWFRKYLESVGGSRCELEEKQNELTTLIEEKVGRDWGGYKNNQEFREACKIIVDSNCLKRNYIYESFGKNTSCKHYAEKVDGLMLEDGMEYDSAEMNRVWGDNTNGIEYSAENVDKISWIASNYKNNYKYNYNTCFDSVVI